LTSFSDSAPLAQLKAWFEKRKAEGDHCPVCQQHFKVYRRKINSGMARSLISMYRAGKTEFIHIPTTIGSRSREEGKLRYWGLVEEETALRPDGGRAGYWRVTEMGELFVLGKVKVPMYAEVYDGERLSLSGDMVGIIDALGQKFHYGELMAERAS